MKRGLLSIVAIGVLAALLIVALENPQPVLVHLPGWQGETPLFVLFVVGFILGGILAFLILLPARIRLSWRLYRLQQVQKSGSDKTPAAKATRNPLMRALNRARGMRES
jgi:uncharacterized integral membrane protein